MQFKSLFLAIVTLFYPTQCNQEFDRCVSFVRLSKPVETAEDTMLQVYALYKQAVIGDCPNERVGEMEIVKRKKLKAWCNLKGMTKQVAELEYIKLIDSLVPDWRSAI